MISKNEILQHYNFAKKSAHKHFNKNNLDRAVKYIELAANIGYKYNFKYCDEELENLISNISLSITPKIFDFELNNKRIVFFDSFGNNRVLAQQYLRAIFALEFEVLYIYTSKKLDNNLKKELLNYKNIEIIHLHSKSFESNIKYALSKINNFKPYYTIQHVTPWDVLTFCICKSLEHTTRYLINLTDHTFWLGKNSTDYILEFRNYGAYLSVNQRNLPYKKILLQTYYPIQHNNIFLGFPKEVTHEKTLIFSGAALYKIYGKNGFFLEIIKRILNENKNVLFLIAGGGNNRPIKEFIHKNQLQGKIILLGDRSDINEIIKRIDIYVNTYPIIGGLMSQFAAIHHKPIIGFTNDDLFGLNNVEDLLQIPSKGILVKNNIEDFHFTINKLIKNKEDYNNNISSTNNCIVSPEEFAKNLFTNLTNPKPIKEEFTQKIRINLDAIFDLYVDIETNFIKRHYNLIWNYTKTILFKDNFKLAFTCIAYKAYRVYEKAIFYAKKL